MDLASIASRSLCCCPITRVMPASMSFSTPSIRISQHSRYPNPPTYPSFASSPMAIPRAQELVPPPLPPPSYIPDISPGHDPGWQWGNDPNVTDFGRASTVKPGSSLLGGSLHGFRHDQERDIFAQRVASGARRGSSISTVTVDRDCDVVDEPMAHSDEDGSGSRPSSNYRCVSSATSHMFSHAALRTLAVGVRFQ